MDHLLLSDFPIPSQHFGTQSARPLLCIPSVLRTLCVPFIWSDPHINQIAWLTSDHRLFTAKAKRPNMRKEHQSGYPVHHRKRR